MKKNLLQWKLVMPRGSDGKVSRAESVLVNRSSVDIVHDKVVNDDCSMNVEEVHHQPARVMKVDFITHHRNERLNEIANSFGMEVDDMMAIVRKKLAERRKRNRFRYFFRRLRLGHLGR